LHLVNVKLPKLFGEMVHFPAKKELVN